MSRIAVVANTAKTLDGGLPNLRKALERRGVTDVLWYETPKSRKAPKQLSQALEDGAELIFVWGGDGTVQRAVEALAKSKATLAIVPAGTANILASNLGIPRSIEAAVEIGLHGDRRKLDLGRMNGERFAVMAGAGFDARVVRDADAELKRRLGRLAYVWAAAKDFRGKPFEAEIEIDGRPWYAGPASSILVGNVGHLFAGIEAFHAARPDDGLLDVGVTSAKGVLEWSRTIVRSAIGDAGKSPFVHLTQARMVEFKVDRKVLWELDGDVRKKTRKFRVDVEPGAVNVRVPAAAT